MEHAQIRGQIHKMFAVYGPTFEDLAIGSRGDMAALLQFYGAPLRFVGDDFHMIMIDDAAILGPNGMGGEIERLRQAGFAGSTLDQCDITILNRQAALVQALWLRRDTSGAVMSRFGVVYIVALTPGGWRITSAVNTSN